MELMGTLCTICSIYCTSKIALRKLIMIDVANTLSDLKLPQGNRLEKLSGDKKGFYNIRINDKYRICFKPNNIGNEY